MEHDDLSFIEGHEQLRALYGEGLCFHDAEVVTIFLDRGDPESDTWSPSLSATFHLFAVARVDPGSNHFVFKDHSLVTIRFGAISDLELGSFNHQNALMDLHITPIEPPDDKARYHVDFLPSFGVGASFRCRSIVLLSITAGLPAGSVYSS